MEMRRVGKQLVARRDIDDVAIEGDAAKTAVPAPALPVDVRRIPIDDPTDVVSIQVDQVNATVALALVAAAHHRGRDQLQRSGPFQALAVTTSW